MNEDSNNNKNEENNNNPIEPSGSWMVCLATYSIITNFDSFYFRFGRVILTMKNIPIVYLLGLDLISISFLGIH